MDPLTALSAQFDPLRPLEADETDLYVDWQDQLDTADDVKVRLVNSIARSPWAVTRLFTGHRDAGKTTELNRVRQHLQDGISGRRVFVSMLFAERWVHLEDVQPEDLVYQIVRQLVVDLTQRLVSRSLRRNSATRWEACAIFSRDGLPSTRPTWASTQ